MFPNLIGGTLPLFVLLTFFYTSVPTNKILISNSISGNVYEDINANGSNDGESGIGDITVRLYIDNNQNGLIDGGDSQIATQNTAADGSYDFDIDVFGSVAISKRLNKKTDDARQRPDDQVQDDRIGLMLGSGDNIGVRFSELNIPADAIIDTAYIQFTSRLDESNTPSSVTIRGEDFEAAEIFHHGVDFDLTDRPTTTEFVNWDLTSSWITDEVYSTPDITNIVQEIIDNNGALKDAVFILTPTGSEPRVARAFDNNPNKAPEIFIEYSIPDVGDKHFLIEIDQESFSFASQMVTDNIESAIFSGEGESDSNNDFGYITGSNIISGNVFEDLNINGTQQLTEAPIGNISVVLYEDINGDGLVDGGDLAMDTVESWSDGTFYFSPENTGATGTIILPQVSNDNDDAEENLDDSTVDISGNDIDMAVDGPDNESRLVGLRFNNINIPPDAIITGAVLGFVAADDYSDVANLEIYGEDSDNAIIFTSSDGDISSRTKTNNSVSWNGVEPWTNNDVFLSPDVSSIVQEIVNRSGWSSGNSIVMMVEGEGLRSAISHDGLPAASAVLGINYNLGIYPKQYVMEVLPSSLPAGYYFSTDNIETANFTSYGETESVNNFGLILPLEIVLDSVDVSCYGGNNGGVNATVSHGVPPYTYHWSSDDTNPLVKGLAAGTYTVRITDSNTIQDSASIVVNEPSQIIITVDTSHISCNGLTDGSTDVTVSGGTPPYEYLWSNDSTTQDINGLAAGSYKLLLRDENDCRDSIFVEINEPSELTSTISIVDTIICNGESDGIIQVIPSGGTAPYTYEWEDASTNDSLENVSQGKYLVTITDNRLCSRVDSIIVTEPLLLTSTINIVDTLMCNGDNDGIIQVIPSGGTAPYTYEWEDASTNDSLENVSQGKYLVTITDNRLCSRVDSIVVTEPLLLTSTINIVDTIICNGESDGIIQVIPSGGTAPYTYEWEDASTNDSLENVSQGKYLVTITDNRSCTKIDSIIVTEPTLLNPTSIPDSTTCFDGNDGSINLTISGGVSPYNYAWSTGATTEDVTGLSIGLYTVTITDDNGCIDSLTTEIESHDEINPNPSLTHVNTYLGSNGEIDANPTGGVSPYTYEWSTGSTSDIITGLIAGDYIVTVTDAIGCKDTLVSTIIELLPIGSLNKVVNRDSSVVGENFYYTLTYSCAGTTGNCDNVVVIDTLPDNVEFVSFTENLSHSSSTSYNAGTHTVRFELNKETGTGLLSGSSGEVGVQVRFLNGSTPDGEIAENFAVITSDNTVPTLSDTTQTKAIADIRWTISKELESAAEIVVDEPVTYEITIEDPSLGAIGGLDIYNVEIVDTLPLGVSYISSTDGGVYNAIDNTVTWTLSDLIISTGSNGIQTVEVTVVYPNASFSAGGSVSNIVIANGDPVGVVDSLFAIDTLTNLLQPPNSEITISKTTSGTNDRSVGESINYNITFSNSGNVTVDNFVIVDTFPVETDVTSISTGRYSTAPLTLNISYQTNLNTTWTAWTGSPFTGVSESTLPVSGLGLVAGEYLTMVRYDFGSVDPTFTTTGDIDIISTILNPDQNGNPVVTGDAFSNCADYSFDYSSTTTDGQDCSTISIIDPIDPPELDFDKGRSNSTRAVGESFNYLIIPRNTGGFALESFVVIDTLPVQMDFERTESGGWSSAPSTNLYVRYQTNLNTIWTDWPSAPFDGTIDEQLYETDLGLAAGEYITMLMWDFGTVPVGFTHDGNRPRIYGTLLGIDRDGNPVNVDDVFTNCATLSAVESGITLSDTDCESIRVVTPDPPEVDMNKGRSESAEDIFDEVNWLIIPRNIGGYPLDNFIVIDTLPDEFEFKRTESGGWSNAPLTNLFVRYQTNLNTTWTDWPSAPFDGTTDVQLYNTDLTLAAGEYVTMLMWDFGTVPIGFTHDGNRPRIYGDILNIDRNGNPVVPYSYMENCATLRGDTSGVVFSEVDCESILIRPARLEADPNKYIISPSGSWSFNSSPHAPGDTITFQIELENDSSSDVEMPNPIAMDLLPPELSYVPGSWYIHDNDAGLVSPNFEEIPNYNSTGRTLLRWSWTGTASDTFEVDISGTDPDLQIRFQTVIASNVFSDQDIVNTFYQTSGDPYSFCDETSDVDIYDLDGDGATDDILCKDYNDAVLTIGTAVSIQSEHWVQGQLDADYTRFPDIGNTLPGGIADYRVHIRNTGTVPFTDIQVVDILPFVGDEGVINLSPRYSRWRPNLVGAVAAPPGVTVYYSTTENPCRDVEGIVPTGPPGCDAPGWTTTPPTDVTTVQSLKFDFGSIILNPGDEMIIEWEMRTPVNVLDGIGVLPDTIAWNSFGYIATRTDNGSVLTPSEPVKVGVRVEPLQPGVFGDRVWLDINQNGIQNTGEIGIDGIRVELYEDNGDGIIDPSTDIFYNYTLTTGGGFYLFPGLPEGDYYALFHKPPAFEISPQDAGVDDLIDSDGKDTTIAGNNVAYSPITHIDSIALNQSIDQGFYPSVNGAIGNYVWNDLDSNGIQDEALFSGVNGVVVNLYDNANPTVIFETTITADDIWGNPGFYLFDGTPPGDYFVEFVSPTLADFTSFTASGLVDASDSDADTLTGRTDVFTLVATSFEDSWDAGLILPTGNLSLGNRIWFDIDNDRIYEPGAGEVGFNGVEVNLFVDVDDNNVFTDGVDQYFKTTTTYTNGGQAGYYEFNNLPEANYIVQIPATEFSSGQILEGYFSSYEFDGTASPNYTPVNDPDDNIDNDHNGNNLNSFGISSNAITLLENTEPITDGDADNNTNFSLDVGLTTCLVDISNISVGPCFDRSRALVDVEITYITPHLGEKIQLVAGIDTITVDPLVISSPTTVQLLVAADNTVGNQLEVYFIDNTVCTDTALATYDAPARCGLPDCFLEADESFRLTAVDLLTVTEEVIGNTGIGIEAIEYDPVSAQLLGGANDNLVSIDTNTAVVTTIGQFSPLADADGTLGVIDFSDIDGLARDPINDIWYASGRTDDGVECGDPDVLFIFNPTTAAYVPGSFSDFDGDTQPDDYVTISPPTGEPCLTLIDDLGFDPNTGKLYGIANGSGTYFNQTIIVEIDPSTGTTTDLGNVVYDPGTGPVNLNDAEGFTITLDGRVLIVTGGSGTHNNSLFELFGLGTGGTITAIKLADLIYNDYESITCVVYPNPNEVGDLIYNDANADGNYDVGEPGIPNIIVHLLNSTTNDTLSTTLADASGNYNFTGLPYGTFRVVVGAENFNSGGILENYSLTDDPDATLDNESVSSYLTGNDSDLTLDFGYFICGIVANNAVLNTCDNSNETGSGTFYLNDANDSISTTSGINISYHLTLADANAGINSLISPYSSLDITIYARIESIATGCFSTANLTLNVGAKCPENCNNGIDDDGDGLIDCNDPDCPCCKSYAPTLNGPRKKDP